MLFTTDEWAFPFGKKKGTEHRRTRPVTSAPLVLACGRKKEKVELTRWVSNSLRNPLRCGWKLIGTTFSWTLCWVFSRQTNVSKVKNEPSSSIWKQPHFVPRYQRLTYNNVIISNGLNYENKTQVVNKPELCLTPSELWSIWFNHY